MVHAQPPGQDASTFQRLYHSIAQTERYPDTPVQQRLALIVALIAFGLPIVLLTGTKAIGNCFRSSISHHYYDPIFGTVFVGALMFIGAFLLIYSGRTWLEKYPIKPAAIGAFAVAFFPTTGPGCIEEGFTSRAFITMDSGSSSGISPANGNAFNLFSDVQNLHAIGTGVLLGYLGLYCLFVMTRTLPSQRNPDNSRKASKIRRNRIYIACGAIIFICIAILGYFRAEGGHRPDWWDLKHSSFWLESWALWAFAVAWTTKSHLIPGLKD
ncbi:MAG: hypothetical protein P8X51_02190 [Maritimibacter sp.]